MKADIVILLYCVAVVSAFEPTKSVEDTEQIKNNPSLKPLRRKVRLIDFGGIGGIGGIGVVGGIGLVGAGVRVPGMVQDNFTIY